MTTLRQPQFDTSFESRLAKLDLTAVMMRVAMETNFPEADLLRAEALYRQFLTLKARYPEMRLTPPKLVDEVWDAHVLHTRQYMADCDMLFGAYLHHAPRVTEAGIKEAHDIFANVTVPAYQTEFGVNLNAYGINFCQGADCCQ